MMEREEKQNKQTDLLLEAIRKELNFIISQNEETETTSTDSKSSGVNSQSKHETPSDPPKFSPRPTVKSPYEGYIMSEAEKNVNFLENHASKNIDENLQKMQIDLKQSYELFQSVGEKFENINFTCLKSRIKNLHLNVMGKTGTGVPNELRNVLEKKYRENRLGELTKQMREEFSKHPGEFGDIPELSAFFKACSQLQNGLEQLKRQRTEVRDLSNRMNWATEVTTKRISEIRKTVNEMD